MRLEIGVSLKIEDGCRFILNGGETMADDDMDDVKELADEYRKRMQRAEIDKTVFVQEQKLIETDGPRLWTELRGLLKSKTEAFNREMERESLSWDDPHSNRVSITRTDDGVTLDGGYDEAAKAVFFRCPAAKINDRFVVAVKHSGVALVYIDPATRAQTVNTPQQIAIGVMRNFLRR
jgi:hypothetical protein